VRDWSDVVPGFSCTPTRWPCRDHGRRDVALPRRCFLCLRALLGAHDRSKSFFAPEKQIALAVRRGSATSLRRDAVEFTYFHAQWFATGTSSLLSHYAAPFGPPHWAAGAEARDFIALYRHD
jgi:hypothetical protein